MSGFYFFFLLSSVYTARAASTSLARAMGAFYGMAAVVAFFVEVSK